MICSKDFSFTIDKKYWGKIALVTSVTGNGQVHSSTAVSSANRTAPDTNAQATSGVQDTVELSSKAQAQVSGLKAAIQEANETPAQTSREAQGGDLQAKRLLAREAASHHIR